MTPLKSFILGSALALCIIGTARAGYVSIDEFNGPNMTIAKHAVGTYTLLDNQPDLVSAAPGAFSSDIIGGYRDLKLQITTTAGSSSNVSSSEVWMDGSNGTFAHSQGTNIASRSTLTWNGLNTSPGLNFDATGKHGIAIGIASSDQGLTWVLKLVDGAGKTSTKQFGSTSVSNLTELVQAFSSFTTEVDFDWSDVDSISFIANQDLVASLDTEVDYVRVVPEPAALALLGAGLLGLGLARRRKTV